MSNKKYWIREMSWVEFDERRKETKTVIIPSGACEIYGPHLPMGSDGFAAEAVAEEVAKRTGALIAPMTEVSDSASLKDFVGTLSMSKALFEAWMDELVSQLIDYGFENFMFISGHAGSVAPIQSVGVNTSLKTESALHRLTGGGLLSSTMKVCLPIRGVCAMHTPASAELP